MEAGGDLGEEIGGRAFHDELIQAPTIFSQSHPSLLVNAMARDDTRAVRHQGPRECTGSSDRTSHGCGQNASIAKT